MAKTAKTRNFPDITLPLDDSKQMSPDSNQVLDKSDVRFRRKCPKTSFLSKNDQNLDQKLCRYFSQNKNFHWTFLNNKFSLSNKKYKKTSTVWKKMAKNGPKPYNVTTSNVFLTQKWQKRPKQDIFQTQHCNLMIQILSPVSDEVLDKSDERFRRKCPKTSFSSKNTQILDQKRVQKRPRFFCQDKNFHWPFLNNKLSLNNKN